MKLAKLIRFGLMFTTPVFIGTTANYLNYAVGTSLNNDISKATNNTISSYNDESTVTNLTGFSDYDPIYGGTTYQTIATEDGTIGLSSDKKTLILTGYNGAIIWANNLTKDRNLINWGNNNNVYESQIQVCTINSYVKMYGKDRLVLLFGYTTNYNYNYIINIDLKTGQICSSNGNYAISKVRSGYKNMIVETSNPNKFAVISNYESSWETTSESNQAVMNHTPYVYTVSDGSITENSTLQLKIPHENFSGGDAKFLGYVAGKINSSTNYLFFANVTSNNGGTATSNLFYVVVDDNFNLPNNQVLTSVILHDTNNSTNTVKDYRKTNGLNQFVSIGDRTTNINTIKVALPYYNTNAVGSDITAYGGVVVSEISTSNGVTNSWSQSSTTTSGPINQMSIDNNNIYAAFDWIIGTVTSGDFTKSAVINVADVNSNTANWKIARTSWQNRVTSNNDNDSIVAIPNTNDDSNFKFVLRNKVQGRMDVYYTTYASGSTTEILHNKDSTVTQYKSPKIKVDPNQSLTNDSTIKSNYIASAIPNNILLDKFQYKYYDSTWNQSSLSSLWSSSSIANKNADNNAGTLSFDYKVTYSPVFDSTKQLSYYVSATITGLYQLTNIRKFEFVTDADTTGKWTQILTLKQTKTASQITVDEVKSYFINIDATDKNNATFTSANLTTNDIILTPSSDGTSLKITVNLPASNFPTTNSTSNPKFTQTATFDGFKSDEAAEAARYAVNINTNHNFGNKYPTQIALTNVVGSAITFASTGYDNVAASSWTAVWTRDNVNGTITITSITTSDTSIPVKYRNLLWNTTAPITFSTGLNNTPSVFTMEPIKINNIADTTNLLKPSEIWSEYDQAVKANDTTTLQSNLLYKAIQWTEVQKLLYEKSDLVLSLVNADDTNKTLSVSTSIKDNAKLKYTIDDAVNGGLAEVRFTNEYKQKAISLGKAVTKQFNLTVSVDEIQKLDVNQQFLTNNNINYDNNTETLTADLNSGSIANITKNLTVKNFSDSFDTYKTDILKMFDYSDKYVPEFSNTTFDINTTSISFNVTFNLQNPNQYPNSVKTRTYIININNFKVIPTVSVNTDFINNNNISYDNNTETLTVDLLNATVGNLNQDTTLTNFEKNFNEYKNQLLLMFKYDEYQANLTATKIDYDTNSAIVKVDFNLNDINYPPKSQSFTININNFKAAPTVSVNQTFITNNNIDYNQTNKSLTIDLDKTTIGNINNKLYSSNFINDYDTYKNELLVMFNYKPFVPNFTLINPNANSTSVSIKAEFNLNDTNYQPETVVYTINIINFKVLLDVTVDQNVLDNNNNVEYVEGSGSVVIDVSKDELFNMNNSISYDDFINNFDTTYQNSILDVFEWSQYYTPVVNEPVLDKNNKIVQVDIVFTLNTNVKNNQYNLNKETTNKPDKIYMSVTIIGFKEPMMWKIIKILVVLIIALIILILAIYYSIAIKKGQKAIIDNPNDIPSYMIDPSREKDKKE